MHEKWYAGETISVSIGQGAVSVTPVSMAVYMATLANGGTRVTPHLLKAVDDGNGWKPVPPPPPQSKVDVDPDKLQAIRDGLWMVVNGAGTGGTARRSPGYDVSGKTGTAQVISNQGKAARGQDRQGPARQRLVRVLRAARQPADRRRRVRSSTACTARNAALVAHHMLDTFFAKKEGRPLPPPPSRRPSRLQRTRCREPTARTGRGSGRSQNVSDVRTPPLLPHRLGAADRHPRAVRARRRDDLQHDRRSDARRRRTCYITQLYAIVLGLVAMVVTLTLDYRTFTDKSHLIYIGAARRCCSTCCSSARCRWARAAGFRSAVFNLQPSEFAKVGVALVLAKFFGENRGAPTWTDLAIGGALTAHAARADREGAGPRHGGDAAAGVPRRSPISPGCGCASSACCCSALLLAAPVAWKFALKDYQKSRISTFLDPSQDAKGAGYQQIQARITVGSGGLTGKGFKQGTQGQLRFLPVAHNDFIFSVLAEEQGFAGVLVALGLYLFVILRALEAARLAKDRLGSYLVLGVLASFTFQVVYNITMSAGLAPVKGLTLPLMSYGGSSMIATLAGFGLVLNVRMRRFTN